MPSMPIDPGNQDVEKAQDEEAQVAARRRTASISPIEYLEIVDDEDQGASVYGCRIY